MLFAARVGVAIRAAREARGLSQQAVATALGIRQPSVSSWERGESSPTLETIASLARLLDVDVDDLLGEPDQPAVAAG